MSELPRREAVSSWFGAFVLEDGAVVRAYPAPPAPEELARRLSLRRAGRLTPEEERLLAENPPAGLVTRDRRLAARGATLDLGAKGLVEAQNQGFDPGLLRPLLLSGAAEALKASWDPSIHVEEAVRTAEELDRVENLLAERLESWRERELPPEEGRERSADPTEDPLLRVQEQLEALHREVVMLRSRVEQALQEAVPQKAPNLVALLGAELTARMMARAGGLDRLSQLPASTIQVLGAEKAFFEHLRGRAPPPRHGLLFLHPRIQSASRSARGKLARALAGKVAIAARIDREGAPLNPTLAASFDRRAKEIRAAPRSPKPRGPSRRARSA